MLLAVWPLARGQVVWLCATLMPCYGSPYKQGGEEVRAESQLGLGVVSQMPWLWALQPPFILMDALLTAIACPPLA